MQSSVPLSGGSAESLGDPAKFGVITVSDRASAGIYDDLSGPAILQFFVEAIKSEYVTLCPRCGVLVSDMPMPHTMLYCQAALISLSGPVVQVEGRLQSHP